MNPPFAFNKDMIYKKELLQNTISLLFTKRVVLSIYYKHFIFNRVSLSSYIQVLEVPSYSKNLTITLNATDVDNKNPKFDKTHYTGSISENVRLFNIQ